MIEHVAGFEWRGEGEEAEVEIYASEQALAGQALERSLPAARLPGVQSPVHAAASRQGFGRVAVSDTHAAPGLLSSPEWGLLLVAAAPAEALGVPFEEARRFVERRLSEAAPPEIGNAALRALAETGTLWAAGEGLIEEDDLLPSFAAYAGDPDALGRRALSAGTRDWTRPGRVGVFRVAEVLDSERAEEMDLERGAFVLVVGTGSEDLGRLTLAGHRERIAAVDFGPPLDPPAAPAETEEARDLLAAAHAAANYAAGRAALVAYALRRALGDVGALSLRAAWVIGGLEERDGYFTHRHGLAAAGDGGVLVAGDSIVVGKGRMPGSAPPFGVPEEVGGWPWEETGLCERVAVLEAPGNSSGKVVGG